MNSREKVKAVFSRKYDGQGVMWTGNPNELTIPIYAEKWGIASTREAIYNYLNDDCRWFVAESAYKHPEGLPIFDASLGSNRETLSGEGCFANAETIADIDKYPWPDVKYFDFTEIYAQIDKHQDKMVFTGMWSPFFHNIADFFGMENYFMKMYDNPVVVEAATERFCDFYVEANDLFLKGLGNRADTMFFGNDLGTQLDLFISPEMFRTFVLPTIRKIVEVGKKHNKFVMLHSCGSIISIIPDLIDAGIDVLHPIQAKAVGMDAENLKQYKSDIAFVGGIDAQRFFVDSSPDEIKQEVRRVREILGPNIVISPSHEEILPNVPADNILAMSEAAHEHL
jgi:uroporphyrinogen decarboxylase